LQILDGQCRYSGVWQADIFAGALAPQPITQSTYFAKPTKVVELSAPDALHTKVTAARDVFSDSSFCNVAKAGAPSFLSFTLPLPIPGLFSP
jgi:hypothetical protein